MKKHKIVDVINENYGQFTKSQKVIAQYITDNYRKLPSMAIQEIAGELDVSDATIIRFTQSLGYKGFLDFKNALKAETHEYYAPHSRFYRATAYPLRLEVESERDGSSLMDKIVHDDFSCMKEFYETFDRNIVTNLTKRINSAEFIHIAGFGTDAVPATFLEWYLSILGYSSRLYTDGGFATSRSVAGFDEKGLMIIFSTPRHLKIEKSIIMAAKEAGTYITYISNANSLELSSLCDENITVTDRANEMINSYVAYMSLCNMIIMEAYEQNKENIDKKLKKQLKLGEHFDVLL
ncbi:MAG: MurR/RpiR family transcriptional regulator [Clostridiales bacterium]|nr:MurR/RpiR family transcriptional regulator [Clostridiales bacterium]